VPHAERAREFTEEMTDMVRECVYDEYIRPRREIVIANVIPTFQWHGKPHMGRMKNGQACLG
jgi:hypothetical protein